MVPSAFVMLEAMPLSANGKLDRKRLPRPDNGIMLKREYEEPQGEIEIAIADVWQELFGFGPIGRHDHFFEMGGHSLQAITLIQRLRERDLFADVRTVFTSPTISAMAQTVVDKQILVSNIDIPPNLINSRLEQGNNTVTEEFRI
ncbi:hypothetical protein CWO84_14985 [Methylomonas sp. Kb3]|nr:hypothetical protein CWO84_14985 [Methylomonas sp. Kb3]